MYSLVYILGFILAATVHTEKFSYYERSFSYALYVSTYAAIGAIAGGRLGYVLCYEPVYYFNHLSEIVQLYRGGMSFYGGLFGLVLAVYFVDREGFWHNLDHIAILACIVLPFGRLANFWNGELWGTPTDVSWGMIFAGADNQIRHPVQLYEAVLEGPLLYLAVSAIRFYLGRTERFSDLTGLTATLFAYFYGIFRFSAEFFREPDRVVGYVFINFTLGHLLSAILSVVAAVVFCQRFLSQNSNLTLAA
jgi:phosphatidylglycerol:prolipoprotein diacylglycerol transferase